VSEWIFLRHGESEANLARVFSGHQDVALTSKGQKQAHAAGLKIRDMLEGRPLPMVLSSDLNRAKHTAELAIAAAGIATNIDCHIALRERNLGQWEGESIDKIKASGARTALHSWTGRAPGGESLFDLANRAVDFLATIDAAERILLVGHGGLIRVLLGLIDGQPTTEIGLTNIPNAFPIARKIHSHRWAEIAQALKG
jgi:broad specificity phosphatase PhoE